MAECDSLQPSKNEAFFLISTLYTELKTFCSLLHLAPYVAISRYFFSYVTLVWSEPVKEFLVSLPGSDILKETGSVHSGQLKTGDPVKIQWDNSLRGDVKSSRAHKTSAFTKWGLSVLHFNAGQSAPLSRRGCGNLQDAAFQSCELPDALRESIITQSEPRQMMVCRHTKKNSLVSALGSEIRQCTRDIFKAGE